MIELNDDTVWILGRPNFYCAAIAVFLRKDGYVIPHTAEVEQAHVIHWLLCIYEQHGDSWRDQVKIELDRMRKAHVDQPTE